MEPGESTEETAIREVREESGFDVVLSDLLGVDVIYVTQVAPGSDAEDTRGLRVVYRGHIVGGQLEVEQNGSTDDVAWIPLTDVGDLERVELVDSAIAMLGSTAAS